MPNLPPTLLILLAALVIVGIEFTIGVKSGKWGFGTNFLENEEGMKSPRSVQIFYRAVLLGGMGIAAMVMYFQGS